MKKAVSKLVICFCFLFLSCSSLNKKSKLEVDKFCAKIDGNLNKLSHITDKSTGFKSNVYFEKKDILKIEIDILFDTKTSIYFYKSKPIFITEKIKRDSTISPVFAIDRKTGNLITSQVFPAVNYSDTLYLYNQDKAKPSGLKVSDYEFIISNIKYKYRLK